MSSQSWLRVEGKALLSVSQESNQKWNSFKKCYQDHDICMRSCPCMPDCPEGCDECNSDFCICIAADNDPDFIECEQIFEGKYHNCLFGCAVDDFSCVTDCSREYHEGVENCPCRVSFCRLGIQNMISERLSDWLPLFKLQLRRRDNNSCSNWTAGSESADCFGPESRSFPSYWSLWPWRLRHRFQVWWRHWSFRHLHAVL